MSAHVNSLLLPRCNGQKKNSDAISSFALIGFFVILGVKSENPGEKQTDLRYVRNIIFFIVNIIQSS